MIKKHVFFPGVITDPSVIREVTGNNAITGQLATLEGYGLYTQRLDQVPDRAREIRRRNWQEGFKSYVLKKDNMGRVEGAVYSGLTEEDLEALDDWELVELGWMVRNKGRARLVDGRLVNVAAFVITDGQEVEEKIEGSEYNPWII